MRHSKLNILVKLMRLDKPTGIWLLLLPGLFGIMLGQTTIEYMIIAIFCLGSVLMRAAGCIINDIFDRNYDIKVERTKSRPLASKQISLSQSLIILSILLLISLVLLLQLNKITIIIGLFSIIPIIIYPVMKRFTYYPQFMLGLTFNLSALMGYSAVTWHISISAIILYIGCVLWTLGYDTIYAHQDKADDIKVGVKSTALKFGDKTKLYLSYIYSGTILSFLSVGYLNKLNMFFYSIAFLATIQLYWQIISLNIDYPKNCASKFNSNIIFGVTYLIAIICGRLL